VASRRKSGAPSAVKTRSLGRDDHPRPQLRRPEWISLDGTWDFALDPEARWTRPGDVSFDRTIEVPFAPETPRSGIADTRFYRACWYRRRVSVRVPEDGGRVLLHVGAADFEATVFANGTRVAHHVGGYTPFTADLTEAAGTAGDVELVIRCEDDPHDLEKPRGKQDWKLLPHSIWYPRTTGLWQTVWLEHVPATYIARVRWTPSLSNWELGLKVWLAGARQTEDCRLSVVVRRGKHLLAEDSYRLVGGELHRRLAFSDPGIDDFRNELLWSPASPTLLDVEMNLWARRGELLDSVKSYTALRSVTVEGDRFLLNGRPYPLRLVLDQGYWPESGLTPPDPGALRRDVELTKAMGFNGVRKHQKIEDPRYLYWADRLGLLVWVDMPSAYRFTGASVNRLVTEWREVLERDYSHPCIAAWVPLNESWGVPNLPDNPAERHYVQALYHLTRTLDQTRPVVGNDGWESVATDIIGIHDYDDDPDRIRRRYAAEELLPRFLRQERPGGRQIVLDGHTGQPIVLSEFGGIALAPRASEWGYARASSARDLAARYRRLLDAVHSIGLLAGFCYTQLTDTYQEVNGLLRADRTPKFPIEEIRAATLGQPLLGAAIGPRADHPSIPGADTLKRDLAPGAPGRAERDEG
jgi:beta-galactosidase/beta-glucuronidase